MARFPGWTKLLRLFRFLASEAGSVAPMMALMLVPLAGTIALGTEQAEWFYLQRSTQNAADAAALAAATNNSANTGSSSTYQAEAAAAAAQFNFANNVNNATVASSVVTCPANTTAGATCYQSTIGTLVPLSFSQVVGFTGSKAIGHPGYQLIQSSAIAAIDSTTNICVLTLSQTGTTLQGDGAPGANLNGCSVYSNGAADCKGHDLGAGYSFNVSGSIGCGLSAITAPVLLDPYKWIASDSNFPVDSCSSYTAETAGNGSHPSTTIAANTLSDTLPGTLPKTGNNFYCGDVVLSGNVTLTGSNTVIVIENGQLDTNTFSISTASGASATIIFSGKNPKNLSYTQYPTGAGTLSIQPPSSGLLSGVAIYQDPNVPSNNASFTFAGSKNPTYNLTGLVYLPNANVTLKGSVNKDANGASCFVLVTYTLTVKGTGDIFANDNACSSAGLAAPSAVIVRPKLVQ